MPVAEVGGGGIEAWVRTIPPVTRWIMAGILFVTLSSSFQMIHIGYYVFDSGQLMKFQFWRLLTNHLFFGPLGFGFIMSLVWIHRYSGLLERNNFSTVADYLWCCILGWLMLDLVALLLGYPIMARAFELYIIYVWSRKNPNVIVNFYFGIQFQSIHFPWVLVAFEVLLGGNPILPIIGIVIGHIYYFFSDVYPAVSGKRYVDTPQWLSNMIDPPQFRGPRPPAQQRFGGGYNWGGGQALGRND
eukprot:GFYU01000405.1.p1 GENE.GFYU01000405.1~~GFYU01000405.1.p1  ORF type:complete len:244 (-),score=47.70 GFYU01000405.1:79-810(-)